MLSKPYESTEVDRKTWLHLPSGTRWSTSSDTHQEVEIFTETSTKMYTPFYRFWTPWTSLILRYGSFSHLFPRTHFFLDIYTKISVSSQLFSEKLDKDGRCHVI